MSRTDDRAPVGTPLSRADAERRSERLKAVADPVRLRLLSIVLTDPAGETSMRELVAEFDQHQSTISHHLRLLCDAGLLERNRRLGHTYYRATHNAVAQIGGLVAGPDTSGDVTPGIRLEAGAAAAGTDAQLRRITEQLAARFAGVFSAQTVDRYVRESYRMLSARARVHRFLPSLTASFAADRLSALAKVEADQAGRHTTPEVLFVCVRNAGRSQMAAGLLMQLAGRRLEVRSAGSFPTSAVDPNVISAMNEIGVHLGGTYPKPLTDEVVRAADVVVTMGCGDACPVYPGKRYLDWPIPDPAGKPLDKVREIRDSIDDHVRELAHELLPARPQ